MCVRVCVCTDPVQLAGRDGLGRTAGSFGGQSTANNRPEAAPSYRTTSQPFSLSLSLSLSECVDREREREGGREEGG